MAFVVEFKGVDKVIRNLRRSVRVTGASLGRGLKEAGLYLQRESQKIVPVHTGDLKGSAFTRNVGGAGFDTDIIVGYTAGYAVYVHEDLEKAHGRAFNVKHAAEIAGASTKAQKKLWFNRGENQQAKFLEMPARQQRKELIRIIRREAMKK